MNVHRPSLHLDRIRKPDLEFANGFDDANHLPIMPNVVLAFVDHAHVERLKLLFFVVVFISTCLIWNSEIFALQHSFAIYFTL